MLNMEMRHPNHDEGVTLEQLEEDRMAWVFDQLVYIPKSAYHTDVHPDGINTLFPDGHVRWHRLVLGDSAGEGMFPFTGAMAREHVHAWLLDYMDGRY